MRTHTARGRSILVLLVIACAAIAGCAFALMWRPAIAPMTDAAAITFDSTLVLRGARVAAVGQCASCHTADPAAPFAGGVSIATPFGVVYSTNITPDRATGIGAWTAPAFARAMRDGISRDGHHLYPAFPYNHYARLRSDDVQALYAFVMTRDPLTAPARDNSLKFPFNFRPLVAGWNLLYLDHSAIQPDPLRGAEWNRGAYLADALGHCAACHSPRNALGAEDRRRYLGGGEAEGWFVPALNAASPSPLPWSVDHLDQYLRTGIAPGHAIAGGPMQGVTANLAQADPADVRALATYIATLMGPPPAAVQTIANAALRSSSPMPPPSAGAAPEARQLMLGAEVYASACARCHDSGRATGSGGALQLPAAIALYDPDPRSLLRIIREGVLPAEGAPGRWMPGFAGILDDTQLTALAAYLRHDGAHAPPWPNLAAQVQKVKSPQ